MVLFYTGLVRTSIVTALWFLCVVTLEALYWFSSGIRSPMVMALVIVSIVLYVFMAARHLISYLFQKNKPDDIQIALSIGKFFPEIRDKLADALQVFLDRERDARGTSSSLAVASLENIEEKISGLDLDRMVSFQPVKRSVQWLMSVLFFSVVLFSLLPGTLGSASYRLVHFQQTFEKPLPFQMRILPGNAVAIAGDDVSIQVFFKGQIPGSTSIAFMEGKGEKTSIDLKPPYQHIFKKVKRNITYSIFADGGESPHYLIHVVKRPLVRHIQVSVDPPAYTKLAPSRLEPNSGDIFTLKGTAVRIMVTASKSLADAAIQFQNAQVCSMAVQGQTANASFTIHQPDRYWIVLKDTLNLMNSDPIRYSIMVQPDMRPVARILAPGKDVDIDESMSLLLTLEAEDDYGILSSRLGYWIDNGEAEGKGTADTAYQSISLPDNSSRNLLLNENWDLTPLNLFPRDVVSYFFEVEDNDPLSGPKRGRSRTYTARFPSMYEIFSEVEDKQNEQEETLSDVLENSRELHKDLQKISEDMKRGKSLEWEERKSLENMTDQQNQVQNKIQDLQNEMDQIIEKLERFDLVSLQTLEKYQELQELYQEMASPEFMEAMKKLQEKMNQLDEKTLQQAMENIQFSQASFLKSIERTLSLLKRIQIEQKMDELVKKAGDLIDRQDKINKALSESNDTSSLMRDQKNIQNDLQDLQQEMENLHEKMQSTEGMPAEQMEQIMEYIQQQGMNEAMRQMMAMMSSGQGNPVQQGQQILQQMQSVEEMLKSMQKNMRENQKEKIEQALNRNTYRLLQLSQGQETLTNDIEDGRETGNEGARRQMSLISGVNQVADSLYQLAQRTFLITPELGQAIGKAYSEMERALVNRTVTGQPRTGNQKNAMGALNQAVMLLQKSLEQLSGSGSGLGMEQYFMQLEQISTQQMAINQAMRDLMGRGRLSLEEQAAMARLAAEQEALKRALERLNEQYGQQSDIAGRLDKLAEEMNRVVEELKSKKADQKTIDRQERILSRLLDAQRSVHNRDYERKRTSNSGEDIIRKSPEALSLSRSQKVDKIRKDLLRLDEEGYTREYQELIRRYLEALIESDLAE